MNTKPKKIKSQLKPNMRHKTFKGTTQTNKQANKSKYFHSSRQMTQIAGLLPKAGICNLKTHARLHDCTRLPTSDRGDSARRAERVLLRPCRSPVTSSSSSSPPPLFTRKHVSAPPRRHNRPRWPIRALPPSTCNQSRVVSFCRGPFFLFSPPFFVKRGR